MLDRKMKGKEEILKNKKDILMEQIEGKREKRRLKFEDKAENERRIKQIQSTLKN